MKSCQYSYACGCNRKKYNPLIECVCGCGLEFRKRDSNGHTRRYLFGHRAKINHPFLGKKRPDIVERARILQKQRWQNPEYREKQIKIRLGKHYSPSTEFKKGLISWAQLNKGKYKLNMTPAALWARQNPIKRQQMRESRLRQVFPLQDSFPEKLMQNKLREQNIAFETHKPIWGQPDIFIKPNICIFVDGCYWHGCEQCLDRNKLPDWILIRRSIDDTTNIKLRQLNYIVLRFWQHETKKDIDLCIKRIVEVMKNDTSMANTSNPQTRNK